MAKLISGKEVSTQIRQKIGNRHSSCGRIAAFSRGSP